VTVIDDRNFEDFTCKLYSQRESISDLGILNVSPCQNEMKTNGLFSLLQDKGALQALEKFSEHGKLWLASLTNKFSNSLRTKKIDKLESISKVTTSLLSDLAKTFIATASDASIMREAANLHKAKCLWNKVFCPGVDDDDIKDNAMIGGWRLGIQAQRTSDSKVPTDFFPFIDKVFNL
jgi:hypothetical protein